MPKLSLIIPCYNEAKNLPLLIDRISGSFKRSDVEVILVDNGSKDDSPIVLEERLRNHAFIRSVRVEVNQGYGYGILQGLAAATGDYIGWSHADMQTDPADAIRALEIIEGQGGNPAIYVKGRRYGRPLSDTFFTIGMSAFETIFLGRPFWDINAQPNVFPRSFFEKWQDPPHDFSLDLYVYYQARKSGLKIIRFPVKFGERAHGTSHWNVNWQAKVKFIKRTLDFSVKLRRAVRAPST